MKKVIALIVGVLLSFNVFSAVDLNTANQAQLEGVNGIGPAKAKAIIDYRTKNGPFKSVDDLDKVAGFGKATIDKVRPEISVGGGKAAVKAESAKTVKK